VSVCWSEAGKSLFYNSCVSGTGSFSFSSFQFFFFIFIFAAVIIISCSPLQRQRQRRVSCSGVFHFGFVQQGNRDINNNKKAYLSLVGREGGGVQNHDVCVCECVFGRG